MLAKVSSTWEAIKAYYGKDPADSTWKETDMWVKISGTWRQMVPPNAIILYDEAPYTGKTGYLADGTGKTVNLLSRWVQLNGSNNLSTGGGTVSSHTGAAHGNGGTPTTSTFSHTSADRTGVAYYRTSMVSHNHTMYAHTHTTSVSSTFDYFRALPIMYSDKIYTNALILGSASLTSTALTLQSVVDRLLYLSNSTGYNATLINYAHNHGSTADSTYTTNVLHAIPSGSGATTYRGDHQHSGSHTDQTISREPSYKTAIPYKTNQEIFFDQLPTNAIVLFTTDRLPDGWVSWEDSARLIKLGATAGVTGGSASHKHTTNVNTGLITGGTTGSSKYEAATGMYYCPDHTHSWTDDHSTLVSNMPTWINLTAAYKNY